jgi:hypothetical protein
VIPPRPLDPLAGLRGYQMPEALGWWPPAPGWWLLGLLGLLLVLGLVFRRRRRRRRRDIEGLALRELAQLQAAWRQHGDALAFHRDLASLVRRYIRTRHPADDASGLCGEAWLEYLAQADGPAPDDVQEALRGALGRSLVDLPYRPREAIPADEPDVPALADLTAALIRAGGRNDGGRARARGRP